jgi:hypothetical protein
MASNDETGEARWGLVAIVVGSVLLWLALLVWVVPGVLERVLAAFA